MTEAPLVDDRYELVCELGRGAMGRVMLALDRRNQAQVALKLMHPDLVADPNELAEFIRRMEREIQAMRRLSHPHIVQIIDHGHHGRLPYFAMEFVAGKTLAQETPSHRTQLMRQLAETAQALDYAHEQGVVHRDVKPANVMATLDGSAKLLDFGIAKGCAFGLNSLTHSSDWIGTPHFSSPEQITNQPITAASDCYSFTVMIYKLLTGSYPFKAKHVSEMLFEIVRGEPHIELSGLRQANTRDLETIFRAGLARDPAKRPGSLQELMAAVAASWDSDVPTSDDEKTPTQLFTRKFPWQQD